MADMKVSVTQPLIERATQRDSRHCMIAEAILAARPDFRGVMVDLATIRWSNPRTRKRYVALTPEAARDALVRFDQGEAVAPFELGLKPIQVTAMKQAKETTADARAAGRKRHRTTKPSKKQKLKIDTQGQPTIVGGTPLPTGHLSNVAKSGQRYREYGLRQLAK